MINELFAFQSQAVNSLRQCAFIAHDNYRRFGNRSVISLQAPTGSGKTIIMASLIESIYCGTENFSEEPDAIFLWLSDSPALNEQSKQKIDTKADKIRMNQCVIVSDESFDQKVFDDGQIYFLNTQKLSRSGNLSRHSDLRQYTIWETIENTAREKPDKLYFIIDEAHRGMQGISAGNATTIMQRFIKGSPEHKLSPLPVVIGMSATSERFNALAGNTSSSLQRVIVNPSDVRDSGLLKERIILTYPEDLTRHNDIAVLQAASDEWISKCLHWNIYASNQNEREIKPVFVVQVSAGTNGKISDTNLDDVIAKIEERYGKGFNEHEIVHTFGSAGTLTLNGLKVHHVEPDKISEDMRIQVVLFKENLSTGWDCPRAETMMSFRHAEDSTYIAQLLGRMIRTPLQRKILADDSLNEVRLFVPYFNRDTVQNIVNELQRSEGEELPSAVDEESLEDKKYEMWTAHTKHQRKNETLPGQLLIPLESENEICNHSKPDTHINIHSENDSESGHDEQESSYAHSENKHKSSCAQRDNKTETENESSHALTDNNAEIEIPGLYLDREKIVKFINSQGYLTYTVRSKRTNSYLKSLLGLANILTISGIYDKANDEVRREVTDMIRTYADKLHESGKYESLAKHILELRLSAQVFDAFGESLSNYYVKDIISLCESDLDRQLREADFKLGAYGFPHAYGKRFMNEESPDEFKIDCVLFSKDEESLVRLNDYAEEKFHSLDDRFRIYVVSKSERCRRLYDEIISNGDIVSKHSFSIPDTCRERIDSEGILYTNHLLADEYGNAKIKLNGWEAGVLEEEAEQKDFVCWLRNPPRQSWALCLPYTINGEVRAFYPDFLIVRSDEKLKYVLDILEPHNPEFKDNLGKAKGLAKYALKEKRAGRVQLIRRGKDSSGKERFMRLNMSMGIIREKVLSAMSNDELDHIFTKYGEFMQ